MNSLVVFAAAVLAAPSVPDRALAARAAPASQSVQRVHYVANAGVLLTLAGHKILIDAPIREGLPQYGTPSPEERERLERARAPYDAVEVVLVTHWHEDHFSADAVAAHLANNPRAVLVSSEEIVARVRPLATGVATDRLRGVTPAPGTSVAVSVGALKIHVLRIRHNPVRRNPEEHVGFLVEGGGTTVLHVGDADPPAANFYVLRALPRIDLALVPFWYVTDEDTWRRTVQFTMKPGRVVAMHIPPQDGARVLGQIGDRAKEVTLLRDPGFTIDLAR